MNDIGNIHGFDSDTKFYIAGHKGLVGSAIWKNLQSRGFNNLVGRSHQQLDLTDAVAVKDFFEEERPDVVIDAAAHVGGIMANNTYRADFIVDNLAIQQNVITNAWKTGVKHLLFLGSTCIYPREAQCPIKEDSLLTGPLEFTNEPYAMAKIAGIKMCESLNIQYGTNYLSVMPTNLYGPGDNFHPVNGHVLPSVMRKIHLAKLLADNDFDALRNDMIIRPFGTNNSRLTYKHIVETLEKIGVYKDYIVLWGSGAPLREFMWSEDMADAAVHVLLNTSWDKLIAMDGDAPCRNKHINIGTGVEHSIRQVADMIKHAVGYRGDIKWNSEYPDGTMRKVCDVEKLKSLGWRHKVELNEGIKRLYEWYLSTV